MQDLLCFREGVLMMVKRRMLSLFLALVVLLSIPMTAFAMSYEDSSANAEQGIIAEETFREALNK